MGFAPNHHGEQWQQNSNAECTGQARPEVEGSFRGENIQWVQSEATERGERHKPPEFGASHGPAEYAEMTTGPSRRT